MSPQWKLSIAHTLGTAYSVLIKGDVIMSCTFHNNVVVHSICTDLRDILISGVSFIMGFQCIIVQNQKGLFY